MLGRICWQQQLGTGSLGLPNDRCCFHTYDNRTARHIEGEGIGIGIDCEVLLLGRRCSILDPTQESPSNAFTQVLLINPE